MSDSRPRASQPPPRARSVEELAEQLRDLWTRTEVYRERHDEKVQAMQATLATLGRRTFPWTWFLSFATPLVLAAVGAVWTFARYPDAQHFENAQGRTQQQIEILRDSQHVLEKANVELKTTLDGVRSAVDAQTKKLDIIIGSGATARPRQRNRD